MNHGFIGFGNLARAIYSGIVKKGWGTVRCYTPSGRETPVEQCKSIEELVFKSDIIWLGIKPQNSEEVLEQVRELDFSGKTVVSPIAGKSIDYIERYIGKSTPIVRIMPNLAIEYGNSVTAVACNESHSSLKEEIIDFLKEAGQVVFVPETHFALFTAIFGSGPAFLLKLIDVQRSRILELGMAENEVNIMMAGLLSGTADYFRNNCDQFTIDQLISNIASRGGTTEAGLKYLKDNNIDKHYDNVIDMAVKRGVELGVAKNY